jgi:L-2-hydroxyglutarate oxidase
MKDGYDLIIVGGGIVGLAIALRILERRPGTWLLLLEKEHQLAMHQSGHNSGVIHSGLYYKPGSLKARNCTEGYRQLLDFCEKEAIPYDICGKVVVATRGEELPRLEELHQRGTANGLTGLRVLSPEEIREIEPRCAGIRGLHVPQTGIVDYRAVAAKYAEKVVQMGGEIRGGHQVTQIRQSANGVEVMANGQGFVSRQLVTCGGLQSDRLARLTKQDLDLRIIPFRGEYYKLTSSAQGLVRHLIYPVPDPAFPFLGVHFTRMIDGGVECGPNAVLAFAREGYRKTDFSPRDMLETLAWPGFRKVATKYWRAGLGEFYRSFSKVGFVRALQRLVPDIRMEDLELGGSGVRAQACSREGSLIDDFFILKDGPVVHVCNAPSPAATASLAIGASIADQYVVMTD